MKTRSLVSRLNGSRIRACSAVVGLLLTIPVSGWGHAGHGQLPANPVHWLVEPVHLVPGLILAGLALYWCNRVLRPEAE